MLIKAKRNVSTCVDVPKFGVFSLDKGEVKNVSSTLGNLLLKNWPVAFEEVKTQSSVQGYANSVKDAVDFVDTYGKSIDDVKFN